MEREKKINNNKKNIIKCEARRGSGRAAGQPVPKVLREQSN